MKHYFFPRIGAAVVPRWPVLALTAGGILLSLLLLFSHSERGLAHENQCEEFVDLLRLATSEQVCRVLNNNWACYGNNKADVLPVGVQFNRPRDRVPVLTFDMLRTNAPNGIVLMRLQTLGEPVNLVLFGDAEMTHEGNRQFTMRMDDGNLLCENTPAGLVARTRKGETGLITVNGVEIELGSTVFVTRRGPMSMYVSNLEGAVTVRVPRLGIQQALAPGEQVQIILASETPIFLGEPKPARDAGSPALQWLAGPESGLALVGSDPNPSPAPPTPTAPPTNGADDAVEADDDSDDADEDEKIRRPRATRRIRDHLPRPQPSPQPTATPTPHAQSPLSVPGS